MLPEHVNYIIVSQAKSGRVWTMAKEGGGEAGVHGKSVHFGQFGVQ